MSMCCYQARSEHLVMAHRATRTVTRPATGFGKSKKMVYGLAELFSLDATGASPNLPGRTTGTNPSSATSRASSSSAGVSAAGGGLAAASKS
jgi:hypothetical protein